MSFSLQLWVLRHFHPTRKKINEPFGWKGHPVHLHNSLYESLLSASHHERVDWSKLAMMLWLIDTMRDQKRIVAFISYVISITTTSLLQLQEWSSGGSVPLEMWTLWNRRYRSSVWMFEPWPFLLCLIWKTVLSVITATALLLTLTGRLGARLLIFSSSSALAALTA